MKYDIFIIGRGTMKKNKKVFSFLEVSIIVVISSFIMCFLGAALIYKHLGGVNFGLIDEDEGLKRFIGAYDNLLDNYYDELDKSDLIEGAISGMYQVTGDPYTTYLDQSSSNSLDTELSGKYTGIGITMYAGENDEIIIGDVYDDSPAQKAGMLPGDIIVKMDGEAVFSNDSSSISDKIKSSESVVLTVSRNGVYQDFTVSADTVLIPVVKSYLLKESNKNIGYIRLSIFSETADIQFGNHLNKLEAEGIDSLIIDLRDNSGGYLQISENIAEMFLQKGKLIYSLQNKTSKESTYDDTSESRNYKIAVILNGRSASASEILAGALKYSYGATFVGGTSYGKGKVQEKANLSSGTTIKYTTAEWLLPNGQCIDGIGLEPDIMEDLLFENYDSSNIYSDNQVMRAVKYLVE